MYRHTRDLPVALTLAFSLLSGCSSGPSSLVWDYPGRAVWAQHFTASNDDHVYDLALAGNDDVFVAGSYESADFDPGHGSLPHLAGKEAMVLRLARQDGRLQWGYGFRGVGETESTAIAFEQGGLYVAGVFEENIELDTLASGPTLDIPDSNGTDTFVVRCAQDGNGLAHIWSTSLNPEDSGRTDRPTALDMDGPTLLVAGSTQGGGDEQAFVAGLTADGGAEAQAPFIITTGNGDQRVLISDAVVTPRSATPSGLAIAGVFAYEMQDLGEGAQSYNGTDAPFVGWVSTDDLSELAFVNLETESGSADDGALAIASLGNDVVVGGYFEGDLDTGSQILETDAFTDGFVLRLGGDGTIRWAIPIWADVDESVTAVATTSSTVYIAGTFLGTLTIEGETAPGNNDGSTDGFVAALDAASGAVRWVRSFTGTDDDIPTALAASDSALYVGVNFETNLHVDDETFEADNIDFAIIRLQP